MLHIRCHVETDELALPKKFVQIKSSTSSHNLHEARYADKTLRHTRVSVGRNRKRFRQSTRLQFRRVSWLPSAQIKIRSDPSSYRNFLHGADLRQAPRYNSSSTSQYLWFHSFDSAILFLMGLYWWYFLVPFVQVNYEFIRFLYGDYFVAFAGLVSRSFCGM